MTESAISGTIVAAHCEDDKTFLRVEHGGNGSKREDEVIVPTRRESLTAGRALRLVNFVRNKSGALVPGDGAKLSFMKTMPAPASDHDRPPAASRALATAPPPPPPTNPAQAAIEQSSPTTGIIAFSDRETRRSVFTRAVEVAREFAGHIRRSGQILKIQGRDYVTVAGWSILPAFEAANCFTVGHTIHTDGTIVAEAIVEKNAAMVSRGFGACSEKDRPKINDRLAMAQTRARGSALKARYSVLVTLAGYESSLADEVDDALHVQPVRSPAPAATSSRPDQRQIEYALKIFDNDRTALLAEVAGAGLLVYELSDVPVAILKKIVERKLSERKSARANRAAGGAA